MAPSVGQHHVNCPFSKHRVCCFNLMSSIESQPCQTTSLARRQLFIVTDSHFTHSQEVTYWAIEPMAADKMSGFGTSVPFTAPVLARTFKEGDRSISQRLISLHNLLSNFAHHPHHFDSTSQHHEHTVSYNRNTVTPIGNRPRHHFCSRPGKRLFRGDGRTWVSRARI